MHHLFIAELCEIVDQDIVIGNPVSRKSSGQRHGSHSGPACRLDTDVRMKPILLKPESDLGSQVIVKGRAIGHMKVR